MGIECLWLYLLYSIIIVEKRLVLSPFYCYYCGTLVTKWGKVVKYEKGRENEQEKEKDITERTKMNNFVTCPTPEKLEIFD